MPNCAAIEATGDLGSPLIRAVTTFVRAQADSTHTVTRLLKGIAYDLGTGNDDNIHTSEGLWKL